MRFLPVAFSGLLFAAALPAHAQTAPAETAAAPRYYVGLAAYSSFYQPIGHPEPGYTAFIKSSSFRLPVQFTAGYYLSPRVAVQVGVAYSTGTTQYGQTFVYNSPTPGAPSPYTTTEGHSSQTQLATSVLARYTLTANPAHRLQVDALGGFTLERSILSNQGTYTNSSQGTLVSNDYDYTSTRNTLLLTGGVGARYRLARRFELTYDFTVNKALNNINTYGGGGNSVSNTLTTSQALGLRYRFGR
jgi:hypothetical protein